MGKGRDEHRDRSTSRNEDVDDMSESSSTSAPLIITQELKRYRELYNEQKIIIAQLQKQNDEILAKLRASECTKKADPSPDTIADPLSDSNDDPSTDSKKGKKRKKKEKQKQARDEAIAKSAKVSENSFVHDNRFNLIAPDEEADTEITLRTIPEDVVMDDNNDIDFEEVMRKKNRKKREDYPSLPMKPLVPIHQSPLIAPEPIRPGRSIIPPQGGAVRDEKVKGRGPIHQRQPEDRDTSIMNENQKEDNPSGNIINQPKEGSNKSSGASTKPPRIILDQDIKDTTRLLREKLGIVNFTIQQNRNQSSTLKLKSLDDFQKTKESFIKTETLYYTFTPRNEKLKSFVLRGLNNSFSEEEVKIALESKGIENLKITNVKRISTRKSINEGFNIPLFVVQISPESDASSLLKIKDVDHILITWEHLRKRLYTQCRRCQRLNHVSANCSMPYRCVKCGSNHEPGTCEIPANSDRSKLFCILCGKNGHPASYSKCPKIAEQLRIAKEQKQAAEHAKKARLNKSYRMVSGDTNFANIVQGNIPNNSRQFNSHSQNQFYSQMNQNSNNFEDINISVKNLQETMMAMFEALDKKISQVAVQVNENRLLIDSVDAPRIYN